MNDDVSSMFRPKLDALGVLHELSLKTQARNFVLFSSISGLLGSRWLAHYTATSAFLDTFAYARRAMGLPATVVNWGLWKSLADQQSDAGAVMANAGLEPMPDEVAIQALPLVMGAGAPVRNTCDVPGTGDGRWMHTGFRQGAGSAALTVPRSAAGACHRHVGSHVDLHKSDCADEGDRSLLALLVPVFVLRPPLLSCVQLVLLSVLILALAFSWQGDPTPSAGSTVEPAAPRIQ